MRTGGLLDTKNTVIHRSLKVNLPLIYIEIKVHFVQSTSIDYFVIIAILYNKKLFNIYSIFAF